MRVRLIEPAAPSTHVFSNVRLPRLGLPIIGAALATHGHDVKIYAADLAPVDWDDVYGADLVGLSATTSTVPTAYHYCSLLRERGIPTIIGGPHVTFMTDEALQHADFVARGEGGDQLMLELIDALQGRRSYSSISGMSYREAGETHHNAARPRVADLDLLPTPDLSLIHGAPLLRYTPVMTSLGCPFNCRFCSVTAMFGRRYRFRSPSNVLAELKAKRPRHVFFYDDNLAADRQRLKTLLQMIIAERMRFRWTAQVRTDVARDSELLGLMRQSGCWLVHLGLESVNQATLDDYKKSQSVADITRAIKTLHEHGIRSHGMFVLGADSDGPEVVQDTVTFALEHEIDTVMLNILTPLPGTPLFDQLDAEGRIFDKDWSLYDAHHVVYQPARMTPYELQSATLRGYDRFYGWRRWLRCFCKLRFRKLFFQTWGYKLLRSWRKDGRNREHMEALRRLPQAVTASTYAKSAATADTRTPA